MPYFAVWQVDRIVDTAPMPDYTGGKLATGLCVGRRQAADPRTRTIRMVETPPAAPTLKKCPHCAELIRPETKVCPHCYKRQPLSMEMRWGIVAGCLPIAYFLIMFIATHTGPPSKPSKTPHNAPEPPGQSHEDHTNKPMLSAVKFNECERHWIAGLPDAVHARYSNVLAFTKDESEWIQSGLPDNKEAIQVNPRHERFRQQTAPNWVYPDGLEGTAFLKAFRLSGSCIKMTLLSAVECSPNIFRLDPPYCDAVETLLRSYQYAGTPSNTAPVGGPYPSGFDFTDKAVTELVVTRLLADGTITHIYPELSQVYINPDMWKRMDRWEQWCLARDVIEYVEDRSEKVRSARLHNFDTASEKDRRVFTVLDILNSRTGDRLARINGGDFPRNFGMGLEPQFRLGLLLWPSLRQMKGCLSTAF